MTIDSIGSISQAQSTQDNNKKTDGSFSKVLTKAINELNDTQVKADKAVADLATGEVTDIHLAAIAIGKAEVSMNLMLEIRNKAINAYKEISRTQL